MNDAAELNRKPWENEQSAAEVRTLLLKVRGGLISPEKAHAWAKRMFNASWFFELFADDVSFDLNKGFWSPWEAIAWIASSGDPELAYLKVREFQVFMLRSPDWLVAEQALRSTLLNGKLTMTALPVGARERVDVPTHKWNDLVFVRQGSADVLAFETARGDLHYTKPRINAADVLRLRPMQTAATERVKSTRAVEKECVKTLVVIMKAQPYQPIAKALLKERCPGVSDRGFDRAYKEAAEQANTPNWLAAGRRRQRPHP